jgi:hypothetical protein
LLGGKKGEGRKVKLREGIVSRNEMRKKESEGMRRYCKAE